MRTDFISTDLLLIVDTSNSVTGQFKSSSYNSNESQFYSTNGKIYGDTIKIDDGQNDEQNDLYKPEEWKVSPEEVYINDELTLHRAECAEVSRVIESQAPTPTATYIRTERVRFDAGRTGTMVNGAVAKGERTIYILNARDGQRMNLSITSPESNAVFDLIAPNDTILGTELRQKSLILPQTGDYEIIVGGTRGNASYDLAIAIE